MKSQSKSLIINDLSPFLICCLFLVAPRYNAQEVDDESEFDYLNNTGKGPDNWGDIKPEWAACKTGSMQSPIDLVHERVITIRNLPKNRNYTTCNANVTNRGHDVQIQWLMGEAGSVSIHGHRYSLLSAHWHSPSEHTINGTRYDMELHMVHLCTDPKVKNKIAVLGALYKIGQRPDKFLTNLLRNISEIDVHNHTTKNLGSIDPKEIGIRGRKVFRYMGSLTVPPCTEGVIWTISKKVKTVLRDQVNYLRDVVHDNAANNARPLQANHTRDIYLYEPGKTN